MLKKMWRMLRGAVTIAKVVLLPMMPRTLLRDAIWRMFWQIWKGSAQRLQHRNQKAHHCDAENSS